MADTIPNLWPDDISTDVLSPLSVLRTQAGLLGRMTKGLLEAEVTTATLSNTNAPEENIIFHDFDLIAPALNRARYRIMKVVHDAEMVYPARVEAEIFEPDEADDLEYFSWPEAHSESEFLRLIGDVLKSSKVKSTVQSLIARSNEKRAPASPSSEAGKKRKINNSGQE